jgi:hypothetical protein
MRLSDLHKRILAGKIPINLLTNLIAYWDMDGNGTDSVSGITPTLETNVTYNNTSILGTSAAITANNAILRYGDRDDFSFVNPSNTGDVPFSISCWVFFTAFSSTGNWLINKRNATSGGDEWQIFYNTSLNRLNFTKFQFNDNLILQRVLSNLNPFSLNTWHHIVATDKGTADFNDMNLYINGVNVTNVRENFGGTYTRMNNSATTLGMMNANWAPAIQLRHQGRLDEVAIWKNRELTPQEVLYLYNNGNGITYPL